MFDLVVRGGTVVDGSGSPGQRADVGVTGETIAAVGDLSRAEAARAIDAAGLVVAPGFIDTHTHAEGALLVEPQHPMGVRQGITTELLGIDGMSYAPLSPANYRTFRRWLGGLLGDPPDDLDMRTVAAFRSHYHRKVAVNTAYLVPHGTVRLEVLGFRDAPLTGDALAAARRLVREGLEQGAVGFSTGSKYYPGPWGDTRELVELCREVRGAGAVYMCEPRSANVERAHGGHGVAEAVEVARRTGVRLHFAHYRTTPATAGRVDRIMTLIDPARADGVDATFDVYPYPAGSSIAVSLLPSEAQEGGPDAILARLADAAERGRLAAWLDRSSTLPLAELVFSYVPRRPDL
jgi:N-acyl-D-amino-acid deacylase